MANENIATGRLEHILQPRERQTGWSSRQMPAALLHMSSASDTF